MKFQIQQKLLILIFLNLFLSCDSEDKPEEPQLPEVVTVTEETEAIVTHTSVEITGSIPQSDSDLLSYGVVWGNSYNPTIEDNVILAGEASAKAIAERKTAQQRPNTFTVEVNDLTPGETYYFRTFATNEAGTAYGEEISIGTNGLVGSKWEVTFHHDDDTSWLAHVEFFADGTAFYSEPDYPGTYDYWGEWSMEGNVLTYDMMPDTEAESYILTGELIENEMSGTYTFGSPQNMAHKPWTATMLSSDND